MNHNYLLVKIKKKLKKKFLFKELKYIMKYHPLKVKYLKCNYLSLFNAFNSKFKMNNLTKSLKSKKYILMLKIYYLLKEILI